MKTYSTTRLLSLLLFLGIVATACTESLNVDSNARPSPELKSGPLTLTLDSFTATTAVFSATVRLDEIDFYSELGVIYSYDDEISIEDDTKISISVLDGNQWSTTVTNLTFGTKVYYTTYLRSLTGVYMLGEQIMSFTTKDVKATISSDNASNVGGEALFTGLVTGLEEVDRKSISHIYLNYSPEVEEVEKGMGKSVASSISDDGKLSFALSNLSYDTKYYYCPEIRQNKKHFYGEVKTFTTKTISVSLGVNSKTGTSVVISGKVTPHDIVDEAVIKVYLNVCEEVSNDRYFKCIPLESENINNDGSFYVTFTDLDYGTEYYYTYGISNGFSDVYSYGDVNSFTTETYSVLLNVDSIKESSFILKGKLSNPIPDKWNVSILVNVDSDVTKENNLLTFPITDDILTEDQSFEVGIKGAMSGTTYFYTYCINNGSTDSYGEVKQFKTLGLEMSSAKYLSSYSSANSYIISESGVYVFDAVKGNSTESLSQDASAEVLWESYGTSDVPNVGDLVSKVSYAGGYLAFEIPENFCEGNAVIAAKDYSGNILWSWHIWLTDLPVLHRYLNESGRYLGTMMDRNLGATSAIPGDHPADLGLLYQWGRKDPFLGSSAADFAQHFSNPIAESTIIWPSVVESSASCGTIEYAIANPTTFIDAGGWDHWLYNHDDNKYELWTTSESVKSLYDPCPPGYRVPDGGSNCIWTNAGFSDVSWDSVNLGVNYCNTAWYPAAGGIFSGELRSLMRQGRYWTATQQYGADDNDAYAMFFSDYIGISGADLSESYCDHAYSVRCLQDENYSVNKSKNFQIESHHAVKPQKLFIVYDVNRIER